MARYVSLILVLLASLTKVAPAQENFSAFCNSGLQADGDVDFSALPPSPNFPGSTAGQSASASAPITATLPVSGVPGLTVQVTIPAINPFGAGPVYSAGGGSLTFNGYPVAGELLQLQFSRAVAGVSMVGSVGGRGSEFSLLANPSPSGPGPNFTNSSDNEVVGYYHFSTSLQAVGAGLTSATVNFSGGGYGNPGVSNLRVQSGAENLSTLVPRQGLEQWLKSDSAFDGFSGGASIWPDQSGNGRDASQNVVVFQPGQFLQGGKNCQGGFVFSRYHYFNFNLPINGWQQMTIFMVSSAAGNLPAGAGVSQNAAICWNESGTTGSTSVSPYQSSVPFRFGTSQVGNQPVFNRPANVWQDYTITRAVHNGSTDSLYVDGLLALSHGVKSTVLSGTTGAAWVGRGLNNTYFNGTISEILVYNRVLTDNEAASVEYYLRNKFGTK